MTNASSMPAEAEHKPLLMSATANAKRNRINPNGLPMVINYYISKITSHLTW
jgi:hypothetical protein